MPDNEVVPSEYSEREDKYAVDPSFVLPDLRSSLPGVTVEVQTHHLDNTYFDTDAHDLRRNGLTLRRRSESTDNGWQLKVPDGRARTEVSVELTEGDQVPAELADLLRGVRRGRELTPIARLTTERTVHQVRNPDGVVVAEVADDVVHATAIGAPPHSTESSTARAIQWREVEVERGPGGSEETLSALAAVLSQAGAVPSRRASKLERALGPLPARPELNRKSAVGDAVTAYIDTQIAAIVAGDLGLRRGLDVIHPTRVAIRRLRSTLRTFGPVVDRAAAADLEADLVWLAGLLGGVRDADVLRTRLRRLVEPLAPENVLGPVLARIDHDLLVERSEHLELLMKNLDSPRMVTLLDRLEHWRVAPPLTARAEQPGRELRRYLKKARRKLDARLHAAAGQHARIAASGNDPAGLPQAQMSKQENELVHGARKAGKRFRYAAELASPVLGEKAAAQARRGEELQNLLGEHQDSVVSVAALRRLGAVAAATPQENAFTFGLLTQQELQHGEDIRRDIAGLVS